MREFQKDLASAITLDGISVINKTNLITLDNRGQFDPIAEILLDNVTLFQKISSINIPGDGNDVWIEITVATSGNYILYTSSDNPSADPMGYLMTDKLVTIDGQDYFDEASSHIRMTHYLEVGTYYFYGWFYADGSFISLVLEGQDPDGLSCMKSVGPDMPQGSLGWSLLLENPPYPPGASTNPLLSDNCQNGATLYCFGDQDSRRSMGVFDLNSLTWTGHYTSDINSRVNTYNAVYYDNKIYTIGDYILTGSWNTTREEYCTGVCRVFDLLTHTWSILASLNQIEGTSNTSLLYGNSIVCVGEHDFAEVTEYITYVEVYNIETNTWSWVYTLPDYAGYPGSGIYNDTMFIFGGGYYDEFDNLRTRKSTLAYDLVNNTLSAALDMPEPKEGFGITYYQDKFYCVAGYVAFPGGMEMETHSNIAYDPVLNTWEVHRPEPLWTSWVDALTYNGYLYMLDHSTIHKFDPAEEGTIEYTHEINHLEELLDYLTLAD